MTSELFPRAPSAGFEPSAAGVPIFAPTLPAESEQRQGVSDTVAMVLLMNELTDLVSAQTALLRAMTAEGIVWSLPQQTITEDPVLIEIDAIRYTVFNDGPAELWHSHDGPEFNADAVSMSPLRSGDRLPIDVGMVRRIKFYLRTASGTATVRIFGQK